MDRIAAVEEQIVTERLRRKINQVNAAAQTELSGIQDHISFTLQKEEMDRIAAAEEQIVTERLRRKINQVNAAAQTELSGIQDHISFTLQQAYFRCAYECFDRRITHDEINNCTENCSAPVLRAQNLVETEIAKFQERVKRSLTVCQDKFEATKLQQIQSNAMKDLESCVDQSIQDNIKTLPHLAGRLKSSLSIGN